MAGARVFALGWSRREALLYGSLYWCAFLAVIGFGSYLLWERSEETARLLAPWIAGGAFVAFVLPYSAFTRRRARIPQSQPVLSVSTAGVTLRSGATIPWGGVEDFYVARDTFSFAPWVRRCSLYLRRHAAPAKEAAFEEVYSAYDGSWSTFARGPAFVLVPAGGRPEKLDWNEILPALEQFHPREASQPTPRTVVVPQGLFHRAGIALMGLIALAISIGCLALGIEARGEILNDLKAGEIDGFVAFGLVAALAPASLWWAVRWLSESFGGDPFLSANEHGIAHLRYGVIPWEAVESVHMQNLAGDDDPPAWALVARVTRRFYNALPFTKSVALALRNSLTNPEPRLPLLWKGIGSVSYLAGGQRMPPEGLEALASIIAACRPATPRAVNPAPSVNAIRRPKAQAQTGRSALRSPPSRPGVSWEWNWAMLLVAALVLWPVGQLIYRTSFFMLDHFDPLEPRVATQPWLAATDRNGIDERFDAFHDEEGRKIYLHEYVLRGTLVELLKTYPEMKVYRREANGAILVDTNGRYHGVAEVTSVQGNQLLLGPHPIGQVNRVSIPQYQLGHLARWEFPALPLPFDENMHYAGTYVDRLNRCELFVVYERATEWPVPVAAIYRHTASEPRLLPWRTNELQRIKRNLLAAENSDFSCYPP